MSETMAVKDWRELVISIAAAFDRDRTPGGVFYFDIPAMVKFREARIAELEAEVERLRDQHQESFIAGFRAAILKYRIEVRWGDEDIIQYYCGPREGD